MSDPGHDPDMSQAPLGPAGWIALVVLFALLGWAAWYAVHVWNSLAGVAISPLGWVFMILAAVITFAVGAGLMWLLFYSSRHHYDE